MKKSWSWSTYMHSLWSVIKHRGCCLDSTGNERGRQWKGLSSHGIVDGGAFRDIVVYRERVSGFHLGKCYILCGGGLLD